MEMKFNVPEMTCNHCVNSITESVTALAGVSAVDCNVDAKTVTVTGDDLAVDALIDAFDDAGFDATVA